MSGIMNVGGMDRLVRFAVGLTAVLLAAFRFHGTLAVIAWIVGILALATATIRVCPAYFLFGVNTAPPPAKGH